jgi:diadenosine tetraphosphate (Ap4A) HIT family hydrolase
MAFDIDPVLRKDCHLLGRFSYAHLLLYRHRAIPWFILVPETGETEVVELPHDDQLELFHETSILGKFIKVTFKPDKINLGAIGNVVRQMHVHVIGRYEKDECWPGVVWGAPLVTEDYRAEEVVRIKAQLVDYFGEVFTPSDDSALMQEN